MGFFTNAIRSCSLLLCLKGFEVDRKKFHKIILQKKGKEYETY